MNKKIISVIIASALLLSLVACSKKVEIAGKTFDASKTYTIAISQSAERQSLDSIRKGLVIGMKDLGFLEDVNIKYIYENAKGNFNYASQIADVYKDNDADVIVTIGDISTAAMKDKIEDKPIVFAGVVNAEKLEYCDKEKNSLIPNMTGVIDSHLIMERLDYISVNYPNVKRLGIIYNSDNATSQYDVDYFKFYATAYDIDIYTVSIKKTDDIEKALDNILPKVDAIALINDYMVDDALDIVFERAETDGKVVFGDEDEHLVKGAAVSSSRDYQLVGRKAAEQVVAIIKEKKKPNELKVEEIDFKIS